MADRWRNWMGNLRCQPRCILKPRNLVELQAIIRRAAEEQRRVRVFGSRHSWMPLAPSDDYLVDMTKLKRCLAIDRGARTITVEAGMTLKRLTRIAHRHGMMLPSPTVATVFTVGGMVATGSAGTSMHTQTFSDAMIGCTIVRSDGSTEDMDRNHRDLAAAQVSLGTFGVFYSLTFQCLAAVNMRNVDQVWPLDKVMHDIPQLVRNHYGVMIMWYPYTDKAWVKLYDPVNEPLTYWWWRRKLAELRQYVVEGTLAAVGKVLLSLIPSLTPYFLRFVIDMTSDRESVQSPVDTFHFQYLYPLCWDSSWAVPLERARDAWQAHIDTIDEFRQRRVYPINLLIALRFTKPSNALLSPAYRRESCFIDTTTFKGTAGAEDFYRAIETTMIQQFNARPHWAKVWNDMAAVQHQYQPQLQHVASVSRHWDPQGMFLNRFLESLFAP